MVRRAPLVALIAVGVAATSVVPTEVEGRDAGTARTDRVRFQEAGIRDAPGPSSGLRRAATDTLDLYGGPGSSEGKFEDALGAPDWQGWTSHDRTEEELYWHVSTYNAANLGSHGAGNHAMWCGLETTHPATVNWSSAPGYGNGWTQDLVFRSGPLTDPTAAQTVELEFFFNYDTEPGYDFFSVAYDAAGSWTDVAAFDGTNSPDRLSFPAPGASYPPAGSGAIVYAGNDYGSSGDEIVLRLRFTSDGAFSDEDGLWPTDGAVQVDDIRVRWVDGGVQQESFEDFEGAGPYAWAPEYQPIVGDFAKLFSNLSHPDPCVPNASVVATFVDDGTPPSNPINQPPVSTGGSLPSFRHWTPPSYGTPGGWVVNYTNGLDPDGFSALYDEILSPPIAFDLPGAGDDGPEWTGALLEYDAMLHAPLQTGIFHMWEVRSSEDGGSTWSRWDGDNTLQFTGSFGWLRATRDLTEFVNPATTHVQVSLQVVDASRFFSFPRDDATPGPWLDNVRVRKFRVQGPRITVRDFQQFQDSFPPHNSLDVTTAAARDLLDVPLNSARNTTSDGPGDSMVATVTNVIANQSLASLTLEWVADTNPTFEENLRGARPSSAQLLSGTSVRGWPQWRGAVAGQPVTDAWGGVFTDQFFFDLPDADFFCPGDEVRYFVRAEDQAGRVSLAPADTSGFVSGVGYDDRFRVRALPTLLDASATQPRILLVDDSGRQAAHGSLRELFAGLVAKPLFSPSSGADTYVVRDASSALGNGLGASARSGATIEQMQGYRTILYTTGTRTGVSLSDGSGLAGNDYGDDVGLLTAWHSLSGNRAIAHIGSGFVQGLQSSPAGLSYQSLVGVDYLGPDISSTVGVRASYSLVGVDLGSFGGFDLAGFCPSGRRFDSIAPLDPGAQIAFSYDVGLPTSTTPAGVLRDLPGGAPMTVAKTVAPWPSDVALTLAFDLAGIRASAQDTDDTEARLRLLTALGGPLGYGHLVTDTPAAVRPELAEVTAHPNPFNPRLRIGFRLGVPDRLRATVHDLRGRRVLELFDGRQPAGPGALTWDGTDAQGRAVASGVYLVRLQSNGEQVVVRAALVR